MISLIVAADENNAIGFNNRLLCRLKDDMDHFVRTTTNKPVIMGYNTFASLGHKPLKNRFNIVLTKSPMAMTINHLHLIEENENLIFESLDYIQFMIEQSADKEFVIIGGQQTYELFLPMASRIYFTRIHHAFPKVDSYFPKLNDSDWSVTSEAYHKESEDNDHPFSIYTFERVG
jgi:dihydrofolate reductase